MACIEELEALEPSKGPGVEKHDLIKYARVRCPMLFCHVMSFPLVLV